MKYKLYINTSVIIEAESAEKAGEELLAMQEALRNKDRLPSIEERDLMLNSFITNIEEIQ